MAWVVVAFLTTLVGLAAINSLGDGILGSADRPLSPSGVDDRLASSQAEPSTPTTETPSPASPTTEPTEPHPQTVTKVLATPGGSVVLECRPDGGIFLKSWITAQGYQADHVVQGPGAQVSIRFRQGGKGHGLRPGFACRAGQPVQTASDVDD
jgi:hypothetical protein